MFLSPISIIAVIVGLVAGGEQPDVYFRRVQRFGRRSDLWLNVFGHRHRGQTADSNGASVRGEAACADAARRSLRPRRGHVNQLLDSVNRRPGENHGQQRTIRADERRDHAPEAIPISSAVA